MRSWSDTRVLEPPPFGWECAGAGGGQFPLGVGPGESSLKPESRRDYQPGGRDPWEGGALISHRL